MRGRTWAALAAVLMWGGLAANAELLLSNIPAGFTPQGNTYYGSSVRYALGPGNYYSTWLAEDFIIDSEQFAYGVDVEAIRWLGQVDTAVGYTAELAILQWTPNGLVEVYAESGLSPSLSQFAGKAMVFWGDVALAEPFRMQAGAHYYVGVRLATEGYGGSHGIASVGNTHLAHSETSAVVKAESFGLTQWTQLDNAPFNWSTNTEYAIELYGKEVPEPSSLILLLSAPLLYALRRR
jgi:hypothetical protein